MFVALQIFNICFFNAMINRWMISFAMINRVLALSVICVQSSNYTNGSEDQLMSATTTTAAATTIQQQQYSSIREYRMGSKKRFDRLLMVCDIFIR